MRTKWNLIIENKIRIEGKKMGQSHENLSSLGMTEVIVVGDT
jgi:hypothetical protein